jgi:hypothetical protein
LRDGEGLSPVERKRRRRRSKKTILGTYHAKSRGRAAHIDLFVDEIVGSSHWALLHVPFLRYVVVGRVLFHEVGHHISRFVVPEYGPREDLANRWSRTLMKEFLRRRYGARLHPIRAVVLSLRAAFRAFRPRR